MKFTPDVTLMIITFIVPPDIPELHVISLSSTPGWLGRGEGYRIRAVGHRWPLWMVQQGMGKEWSNKENNITLGDYLAANNIKIRPDIR